MGIHQFPMEEKVAKHLASNQYKKQNIITIRNGTKEDGNENSNNRFNNKIFRFNI